MKAIRKINNNVAVCLDKNNKELIAFGKGIGFPSMPYEITDLNSIDMTFYRLNAQFYNLLQEIPEDVFEVSANIVTKAQETLNKNLNPNIVFSLADHINFAIVRMKNYKKMKFAFSYDVEQLYPEETAIGKYALSQIQSKLYISLPESEVTNIALHFVNAEEETLAEDEGDKIETMIEEITSMIENSFALEIKRKEFNYNRFVMHLRYYLKRIQEKEQFMDNCDDLIVFMQEERPEIYECAMKISSYIDDELHAESTNDEILYLMIHINRIINKED
ncbi:beta-glucoside operon transcriptional antiterminator [Breznakia sp. PF5-3]|uniref:PRD domain-containing protein n=1 Tax=unclassified Breznakia TaxID=2623764 RepID=UPI002404E175|nr:MULTISPECIES: PRD domain-containing protein [unclassified Breznakia]MDF9823970.1 beta-glucoside operon transcriptional antiterminator [Breznakia sp. PM6-1]MDF9834769.1 beta-glucoside operon transcriptional antiterminator [Breznakia sp. PF5-3]MDF9838377.1 beta-glucoside operon transcriptional antiterminator [Breznakia sp. PFB2-8]MDF9860393.1 beta-glucoside operon transcriptional antiterminator [Breznakia sp. PH5-24]